MTPKPAHEAENDSAKKQLGAKDPQAGPLLEHLCGLGKARTWGEALARDLSDYKKGRLPWRDIDRGLLLYGPPGTGKTTFARALAASCKVPLIATSYAKWQRTEDGHLGAVLKAMRSDFDRAIESAPSIMFIDEVDALPARETLSDHNRDWWMSVIAALLECLDGVSDREGVVVIGACNSPKLDSALVRAGRLDHTIEVRIPTSAELDGIIRYHLGNDLKGVSLRTLAVSAVGYTGADAERLVRAARRTARQQGRAMILTDLSDALDDENESVPPEMLRRTAIHEAGHAIAAIEFGIAATVAMSLVPRGDVRAATVIERRMQSATREVIEREIAVALAGRAAEEVVLGDIAMGSGGDDRSDLARASELATKMVTSLGLSENGPLVWISGKAAKEAIAFDATLRDQVEKIMQHGYARARGLIECHASLVSVLADALVEKRGLCDEEIRGLVVQHANGPADEIKMPLKHAAPDKYGCEFWCADRI